MDFPYWESMLWNACNEQINHLFHPGILIFQMADNLTQRFGTIGLRITQRIMGLILMVIAVQFVIDGATLVVTGWLNTA